MLGELIDLVSGIAMDEQGDKAKDILGRVYEYFLLHYVRMERLSNEALPVQAMVLLHLKECPCVLESVRKHQAGLQSFRSMRRIEASRRNASALRLRFSQSLASLRQRLSQAKVRSTTQRRGSTTNPFVRSERLTISVSS